MTQIPFCDIIKSKSSKTQESAPEDLATLLKSRDALLEGAEDGVFKGESMENFTDDDYRSLI